MSNSAVNVEVRLKMQDAGVDAGLKAVQGAAEKAATASVAATEKAATAMERAAEKAAADAERSAARQRTSYERLSHAREALGMRSEQTIQREIDKTVAAYNRLSDSGTLSFKEQTRAAEAMRSKVEQLTNEMGKLTTQQKVMAGIKTAAAIGAGITAAGYVLRDPAKAAMGYDERLADMANTAFAERDVKGRKVGMAQLEAAVNKSVGKGGGGTREQAAEALDTLIASGVVGSNDAMTMLPGLMKASAASGTDALALSQIGIRAMQTFKIGAADMPNVLNMALAAGQAGGFELKDMARWLPQQMAAATLSGMSGRAGFAKLAALNQAAATTAGSKEEAGNNVVNLLAKINAESTAIDAKKQGVDLPKYLAQQRAKGVDAVDAFGALVGQTVSKRADYQALQKQLAGSRSGDEKRAALESMATIAQGAGIGQLIQDRQAMMALLGMMNNRDYMRDVLAKVKANDVASGGAVDRNYELVSGVSGFKVRQAQQQKDIAQKAAMDNLTPAIGKAADIFSDLAQKYPALATATVAATTALAALAATAGASALMNGGKLPKGVTGAIDRAGRLAKSPAAGKALRLGGKVLAPVAAAGAGWEIGTSIAKATDSGGHLWEWFNGDKMRAQKQAEVELAKLRAANHPAPRMQADVTVSVTDDRVHVTRARLATKGVDATMNTGNVHTGAPR